MASLLDKSLDEIIKDRSSTKKGEKKSAGGRGGRGGRGADAGRGGRGGRGGRTQGKAFAVAKTIAKPARKAVAVPARAKPAMRKNFQRMDAEEYWDHDLYDVRETRAPRGQSIETGTKLLISNLHYNVTDDDIKELFEELGSLKRANVQYDRSGRSKGTAEVVFNRKQDAEDAQRRYDGVRLDSLPMQIELQSSGAPARGGMGARLGGGPPAGRNVQVVKPFGGRGGFGQGRGGRAGGGRFGGGGRGGGGRGGGRGPRPSSKSAADLDAELESYHGADMES